jgi:hypothetical protein
VVARSGSPAMREGGQWVGVEVGDEGNPFWHIAREKRSPSAVARGGVEEVAGLSSARPEERRVVQVVRIASPGTSRWSLWMRRRRRTGTRGGEQRGGARESPLMSPRGGGE